jgi:hypothetical protein
VGQVFNLPLWCDRLTPPADWLAFGWCGQGGELVQGRLQTCPTDVRQGGGAGFQPTALNMFDLA